APLSAPHVSTGLFTQIEVVLDKVNHFLRVDAAVENNVRAMLLQVHGTQLPKPPQAPTRVLTAFVAAALILPLGHLGNLGTWLAGTVKMDDTVILRVVMEDDPLRLPTHARLAAIGNHAVRPVRDYFHQPHAGQVVEVRLPARGQECVV